MAQIKLTKTAIDKARHPGGRGALVLWDTAVSGFGLRVHPSGERAFLLSYRYLGKKQWVSLGRYGEVTLEAARERARELREGLVLRGVDPKVALRAPADGLTFRKLGERYMAEWAKPRKRTWTEDQRYLDRDAYPVLGGIPADRVQRREIRELLKTKAAGSPIAANRLLAVIRRVFSWAVEVDLVDASPCVHLRPPAAEVKKERVLSADEIRALWRGLVQGPGRPEVRLALQFVLVTAQRPGEVIGLDWGEIAGGWWTVPPARAKNGKAHRVPLAPLALEILGTAGKGPVFPSGREEGGPVEVNALAKEVRKHWGAWGKMPAGEEPVLRSFTPHDLRRTAASHMTGLGIPRLVVSRILNHAEGGVMPPSFCRS
jgi:integrase